MGRCIVRSHLPVGLRCRPATYSVFQPFHLWQSVPRFFFMALPIFFQKAASLTRVSLLRIFFMANHLQGFDTAPCRKSHINRIGQLAGFCQIEKKKDGVKQQKGVKFGFWLLSVLRGREVKSGRARGIILKGRNEKGEWQQVAIHLWFGIQNLFQMQAPLPPASGMDNGPGILKCNPYSAVNIMACIFSF